MAKDCRGSADQCNDAACNTTTGACDVTPVTGRMCNDENPCTLNDVCALGMCEGAAKDCSAENGECSVGRCNTTDGSCFPEPKPAGTMCDDANTCTVGDQCSAGVCGGSRIFVETFDNNEKGWSLDPNWQVGPALGGCGDPAVDHTPNETNGIAGVVLGGCAPTAPVDATVFHCLTSPVVDTSMHPALVLSYWRHVFSDYTPYMKNLVQVYNGTTWVTVWETFGSPGLNDASWLRMEHDVSAHRSATFRVRFCYNIGNPGAFNRGSWNVDDVALDPVLACQ